MVKILLSDLFNYNVFLEKWLDYTKDTSILIFTSNQELSRAHFLQITKFISDTYTQAERPLKTANLLSDKKFRNYMDSFISLHLPYANMNDFSFAFKLFRQCLLDMVNESGINGSNTAMLEIGKIFDAFDILIADIYHINGMKKLKNMIQQLNSEGNGHEAGGAKIGLSVLTQTEHIICEMIASGLSTKEIADRLNVVCSTVQTHRKRIRRKFNLTAKQSLYPHLKRLFHK